MWNPRTPHLVVTSFVMMALLGFTSFYLYREKSIQKQLQIQEELNEARALNTTLQDKLAIMFKQRDKSRSLLLAVEGRLMELAGRLAGAYERIDHATRISIAQDEKMRALFWQKRWMLAQLKRRDQNIRDILSELVDFRNQQDDVDLGELLIARPHEVPQVTTSRDNPQGIKDLNGQIIEVNEKYGFLVFDLGDLNGIQRGMHFEVYRDEKRIGAVKVAMVKDKLAAATFSTAFDRFRRGDFVRQSST
jgi:hypothetical protein